MEALGTLAGANREIVARHLVMAGQTIDVDPELAYQHAQAAVKRAGRVDVVREAAALTAYATERYEEALREVRAVRRMRGDESLRAIEADSERGLGRPERAIEIVAQADLSKTSLSEQVELVLVSAGARADLEQLDAALLIIDEAIHKIPEEVDPQMVGRLQSYKADILRAMGREEEALAAEALVPEPEEVIEILDLEEILDADIDNVRTSLRGSNGPLIEQYDGLILDLDGVCFEGTKAIDYAGESLTKASEEYVPLAFATNNASRTAEEVAEKLKGFGIPAKPENVITSSMNLMPLLKAELEPGSKVLVVGSQALIDEVKNSGFEPVTKNEEGIVAVVQGYAADVDWSKLSEAAFALNAGARFYATNLDSTLPTENGMGLGNGALVAAVTRATGKRPAATGKPQPEIMLRAADLVESQRPLAVGDRLETDTAAAIAARMPTMHVLTGVSSAEDIIRAPKGLRPSFLALDLRGLFEAHPFAKHHRDGTWTAGNSQPVKLSRWGTPTFSDIEVRDDGDLVTLSLDNYRAFAAAAWDQVDSDRPVRVPPLVIVPNDDPAGTVLTSNFVKEEEAEEEMPAEDTAVEPVVEEAVEDIAEETDETVADDVVDALDDDSVEETAPVTVELAEEEDVDEPEADSSEEVEVVGDDVVVVEADDTESLEDQE